MVYDNTTLELCHDADEAVHAQFEAMVKRKKKTRALVSRTIESLATGMRWLTGTAVGTDPALVHLPITSTVESTDTIAMENELT